jgi:hypothetical protein
MSDTLTAAFGNPTMETGMVLSGQQVLTSLSQENRITGFHGLGGGFPIDATYSVLINMYNPSISLQVMQLAIAEQQRQWSLTVLSLESNVRHLTTEIEELREEIRQLCRTRTFVVPLTTLASGSFQITQQIPVTIEGDGEEFTATFTEANISASGETEADAIANFKDSLLSSFELLEGKEPRELGPLPKRQWRILTSVVKRIE